MDNKDRSPGNTAISISLSEELLYQIDARAKRLGVPRSTYLVQLARKEPDRRAGTAKAGRAQTLSAAGGK